MKKVLLNIDCEEIKTPELLHAYIAKKLSFPKYYGANLDALKDCMSDVSLEHVVTLKWKDSATSKKNKEMQGIRKIFIQR
jgi:ribonuclease inhibitor